MSLDVIRVTVIRVTKVTRVTLRYVISVTFYVSSVTFYVTRVTFCHSCYGVIRVTACVLNPRKKMCETFFF